MLAGFEVTAIHGIVMEPRLRWNSESACLHQFEQQKIDDVQEEWMRAISVWLVIPRSGRHPLCAQTEVANPYVVC